jgi:hypothetical protein
VKRNGEVKVASVTETVVGQPAEQLVLQVGKRNFIRLVFG